jgi:heat shock protein HslJ
MNPYRSVAVLLSAALVALAGCYGAGGDNGADGEEAPPASEAPTMAALATPYRAHGNEPFWGLVIEADSMKLLTPEADPLAAPLLAAEAIEGGRRYEAEVNGAPFTATILETPCADGMSGMPYPHTVIVLLSGVEYHGCGGDPAALLMGAEWVVESIDGAEIAAGSRATLTFDADGRVAGNTSCNQYSGPYRLTGEGISVGEVVSTRKACADALMNQERKFLGALGAVDRFEIDPSGGLILRGGEQHSILARRL